MVAQEILNFHTHLNAISCILRADLPNNITIKSNIILVNLQLFSTKKGATSRPSLPASYGHGSKFKTALLSFIGATKIFTINIGVSFRL